MKHSGFVSMRPDGLCGKNKKCVFTNWTSTQDTHLLSQCSLSWRDSQLNSFDIFTDGRKHGATATTHAPWTFSSAQIDAWTQQHLKQSEWSFHSLYKANSRPQALRWFREEPPPGLRMQLSLCSLWHQCSTICCARELLVRNCYFEGN